MGRLEDRTILVVDDEADLRDIYREELEAEGAKVSVATNGREAMEILAKRSFDAVISDYHMPDVGGAELLAWIRARDPVRPAVLLVTAHATLTHERAKEMGAVGMVAKPAEMVEVLSALEVALVRKARRVPTDWEVVLALDEARRSVRARVVNVGRGGMFIHMSDSLPTPDTEVTFRFENPKRLAPALEGRAICRWTRAQEAPGGPRGIGVEFLQLSADMRQYVALVLEGSGSQPHPVS